MEPEVSRYATGGHITPLGDPGDDRIPVFLAPGCAFLPGRDGDLVELGHTDTDGNPSAAEEYFGADLLRRLNDRYGGYGPQGEELA